MRAGCRGSQIREWLRGHVFPSLGGAGKRPASLERQRKEAWVYDFRTNVHFTLKQHPMTDADLEDFICCFHPENRRQRHET